LGTPAWGPLGLLLTEWGQFEDALEAQERARRLDPLEGALLGNSAWSYVCAGDFERAVVELEALVEGEFDRAWTRAWLVQAYLESGDRQSAVVELDRLEDSVSLGDLAAGHMASLYALADRRPEAQALLDEAEQAGGPITLFHAAAAVSLGERERALGYLQRARELERGGIMYGRCTAVAELAGEPGYEEFLDRIGVPLEGRR